MKKALFLITLIFSAIQITAQEISYSRYMERVLNNNIALTAKRMDIEISDAAVENSRVYNLRSHIPTTRTGARDWDRALSSN